MFKMPYYFKQQKSNGTKNVKTNLEKDILIDNLDNSDM